jgi:heme exporter protein D
MEARPKLVYTLSFLLLGFALLYSIDGTKLTWKFWQYRVSLGGSAVFLFLAFVPGVLAIVYHLVTVTQRRNQNIKMVQEYYKWRNETRPTKRPHQIAIDRGVDPLEGYGPVSANSATILLVAVFLFIAIVTTYTKWTGTPLQGIVYAGLGAYISVLYYTVARLYASALSSRFLIAAARANSSDSPRRRRWRCR